MEKWAVLAASVFVHGWHLTWSHQPVTLLHCHDGDTCNFRIENRIQTVRLAGIDAPERDQAFGSVARDRLLRLLQPPILLTSLGTDRYGRTLGLIESQGQSVNLTLIEDGLAEAFMIPGPQREAFLQAQHQSRLLRNGMWSQFHYQSPKDFRAQHKKMRIGEHHHLQRPDYR